MAEISVSSSISQTEANTSTPTIAMQADHLLLPSFLIELIDGVAKRLRNHINY